MHPFPQPHLAPPQFGVVCARAGGGAQASQGLLPSPTAGTWANNAAGRFPASRALLPQAIPQFHPEPGNGFPFANATPTERESKYIISRPLGENQRHVTKCLVVIVL